MIDRTEPDERTEATKQRETVDDDPGEEELREDVETEA